MLNEARTVMMGDEIRRLSLHRLDVLLSELESLNLEEAGGVPTPLAQRLHAAGVGFHNGASITSVIDQVFKRQECFLTPIDTRTRRRKAA